MKFHVRLQPPDGDPFDAWVDEDNAWEVPSFPGDSIPDFLQRAAETQIAAQGGIPAQPDPRSAYAWAMAESWPGSEVLTKPPKLPPEREKGLAGRRVY